MNDPHHQNQQPHTHRVSMGEKLLIVALVVGVGVLFGMGSQVEFLFGRNSNAIEYPGGVKDVQVKRLAKIMATVLPMEYGQDPAKSGIDMNRLYQPALDLLQNAYLGEQEGMMPKGELITSITADYLQQTGVGEDQRPYQDILAGLGGSYVITPADLKWYLSIKNSADAYTARYNAAPAVSALVGHAAAAMNQDRVTISSLTLSAQQFVDAHKEEAAADESLIDEGYKKLKREDRFNIARRLDLTLFVADPTTIQNSVVVAEEAISAWYEEHKEDALIKVPAPTPAEGEEAAAPTYKPLADVSEEIRSRLAADIAQELSIDLIDEFDNALGAIIETEGDSSIVELAAIKQCAAETTLPATLETLSEAISMAVIEGITVDEPSNTDGTAWLQQANGSRYARINTDQDRIFQDVKINGITSKIEAGDKHGLFFIGHIGKDTPADYRTLEDAAVKEEVIAHVAAQLAWPDLYAAAQALQTEALAAKSLQTIFTEEKQTAWNSQVEDSEKTPMQLLTSPTADIDTPGDTTELMLLADKDDSIVLEQVAANADGIPQIRIVHVQSYNAKQDIDEATINNSANYHRRQIWSYIGTLADETRNKKMEE